jgi:hypothetical protein
VQDIPSPEPFDPTDKLYVSALLKGMAWEAEELSARLVRLMASSEALELEAMYQGEAKLERAIEQVNGFAATARLVSRDLRREWKKQRE